MRLYTLAPLSAFFGHLLAAPAVGGFKELQERGAPAACAHPLAVSLAYDVLSVLHADNFCTGWLGITTQTVSATQSVISTTSTTALTTSVSVVLVTASTTTVVSSTTTVPSTVTAATATTTVSASTTVFNDVIGFTTSTITTTSTSTTIFIDIDNKKHKRAVKPAKLNQLKAVADDIVSSACSCIATTPTFTTTLHPSSTLTVEITSTIVSPSTSTASTFTEVQSTVITEISTITITPTSTITSIATLTSPSTIATFTETTTRTQVALDFVDVFITPVEIDGCAVGTSFMEYPNIGGATFEAAAQLCALKCVATGKINCENFYLQQNLPSGTFDCFMLRSSDEPNTNFHCNNPNIGRAAEWLIVY